MRKLLLGFVTVTSCLCLSAEEILPVNDLKPQLLASGMKFTEGPVWVPHRNSLVFSDIPQNALMEWSEAGGLNLLNPDSKQTNGNSLDSNGNIVSCRHGARDLAIITPNGKVMPIPLLYNGKKLNSPNDLAIDPQGRIWFTDPTYGLKKRKKEQPLNGVYRYDPANKKLDLMVSDFNMPNGICFSHDWKNLYIADSSPKIAHVRKFEVKPDGSLSKGKVFCKIPKGVPDGMRCDSNGRLYVTSGEGIHIFNPDGSHAGLIKTDLAPSNLCFGGPDGQDLFITARSNLYKVRIGRTGAGLPVKK